jgi:outer membrane protein TolC
MFFKSKKHFLLYLFFYQSTLLFSQNVILKQEQRIPLSIDETWSKAVESSKKINLSSLEASLSKEEIKESQYERFPEISLKGNYEYATNIPVYENGLFHGPTQHEVIHLLYKLSTDFYVNVYNGNKLNLKIDKKKILYEIAEIQKGMTVSEIKLQASVYYLNLRKSLIFKDLMVQDIVNQEKQLFEIKELYKHGVILKSDVLRLELKLSNQKMLLVKIENDIAIANQKLTILIGLPDHAIVNPYEDLDPVSFDLKSYDDYLEIAEKNSYDYHISEKEVALKKIELKNIKANVKPKIGISGEFYLANPQIFLYPYSPNNYTLGIFGLRASIPLSELFVNKPKERIAKLNLEKEELEHHHTDDKMREQVYENYLRFKESILQIDVAKADIEQSTENARIVRENYFNQSALITDLLDADIQLLQSRFSFASAKINAQIQYYQLQNVLGTL